MPHRPLVHPFHTRNQRYFYDLGTNDFYLADDAVWERFYERDESQSSQSTIDLGGSSGIRAVQEAQGFAFPTREWLTAELTGRLGALILCVSEECNMRCSYCTYGGQYRYVRHHSSRHMDWEIARDAIDYYLARTTSPAIGFFGGEPLLAFDLLVKCLEHSSKKVGRHDVNMTTNGTLLRGAVVDWLAKSEVNLLVSVDGTEDTHDRHRRFRSGQPTYSTVLGNLLDAASRYPKWFEKSVRVQMVVTPPYDLHPYEAFVRAHRDLFRHSAAMSVSFVNTQDNDAFSDDLVVDLRKDAEICRLRRQYREAHASGERSDLTIEPSLFDSEMFRIHRRPVFDVQSDVIPLNGVCFPGLRRLYVDVNGRFHICERVNSTLPIGSIVDGIDVEAVWRLLLEYASASIDTCRECWAARFCPLCFVHAAGDGRLDRVKKNARCDSIRNNIEQAFVVYNEALEDNPEAFSYMDEYYIR